ncbi:hypothetical protein [Luteibacter sp. UNCMF366Tsu5.1]|uniref:hypothetical protein n=1 Tax=Luteibacter sp. UNCMF366Tsu5.1 TaxID=1502758 RepID=UPI0009091360|nr:hypothetical protein [Luteibacter sp. UNCMF366Tsu5.1]SFW36715.1 hypothetical protein SAMN02800691_1360 [Luteibacter sp. UNCMF366Tsu5.1]
MRDLTHEELACVNGGLLNRVEFCVGATSLIFGGAGAVIGGSGTFGFGAGIGFGAGATLGNAVGQMACSSFFSP